MDAEIVVIGAGLAGLACATTLHDAGRRVCVLEAAATPGGRVRTDHVECFTLDRGFQVLLTAYPELCRHVDLDALDIRAFRPGVVVQTPRGPVSLKQPSLSWQTIRDAIDAYRAGVMTPSDAIAMHRWQRDLRRASGTDLAQRTTRTTRALFDDAGFSPRLIESFLAPMVRGIFADGSLATSSRMTELVFRSFFVGTVGLPTKGMGAITAQMAARLGPAIRYNQTVERVEESTSQAIVTTRAGERLTAKAVVVATEGPQASLLVGQQLYPSPTPGRGSTTIYYDAAQPLPHPAILALDATGIGPATTVADISSVAPPYAPAGRHLIAASIVGVPGIGDDDLDASVRRQLRSWYGESVDGWRRLAIYRIPYALPRQDADDLAQLRRDVRITDTLWVCGDHRDTGSIQGALVSGRRTAQQLMAR